MYQNSLTKSKYCFIAPFLILISQDDYQLSLALKSAAALRI